MSPSREKKVTKCSFSSSFSTCNPILQRKKHKLLCFALGKETSHIFFKFDPLNTNTFYGPLSVGVLTQFDRNFLRTKCEMLC